MKALFPVVINITAVVLGKLMMMFKNEKTGIQTQGEAVKTNLPCPNGVSA